MIGIHILYLKSNNQNENRIIYYSSSISIINLILNYELLLYKYINNNICIYLYYIYTII